MLVDPLLKMGYELGRIANLGANRWGLDLGSAFTMGNFKKGREFSGVLGVTLNGENPDTDYRSGTDLHLELTYKQLLKVAADNGLTLLDPTGETFNPEHHQAISQVDAPAGVAPGAVVTVFQKGYLLNDRLLRPALVVVAKHD